MKKKKEANKIETVVIDTKTGDKYLSSESFDINSLDSVRKVINKKLLTDKDYFEKMWRRHEFTGNSNYVKVRIEEHLITSNPKGDYVLSTPEEKEISVSNSLLMFAKLINSKLQTYAFDDNNLTDEEKLFKYQLIDLTKNFEKNYLNVELKKRG